MTPMHSPQPAPPSPWICRWSHLVPPGSPVLDVACGSGRHLRWFHERNHPVAGLDKSQDAIDNAAPFAEAIQCDLEAGPWPLPGRSFGAVIVTHYLWRPLFPAILAIVAPGGVLLYETFAVGNAAFGRPARPEFLLRPGELLKVCTGLRIVAFEEGLEECAEAPCRFADPAESPDSGRAGGAELRMRCIQRIAAIRPAGGQPASMEPGALPRLR